MSKIKAALVFTLLLTGCGQEPARPPLSSGPFIGIDLSKLSAPNRQILTEASEDFRAVVSGKKPIHAVPDTTDAPSDGGTTFYRGNGYRLTRLLSFSGFGGVPANAYGPIIKFDREFAPGNTSEISDIRVYSSDELSKFIEL